MNIQSFRVVGSDRSKIDTNNGETTFSKGVYTPYIGALYVYNPPKVLGNLSCHPPVHWADARPFTFYFFRCHRVIHGADWNQ